jgi:hypothetical protein
MNDQSSLKNILNRIYGCCNLESLNAVAREGFKRLPKHRKLITAAKNEMANRIQPEKIASFEAREEKTRKLWFKYFTLQYVFTTLILLPLFLYISHLDLKGSELISTYLLFVNIMSVFSVIDYFFSYRKKGTKWLTFLAICYVYNFSVLFFNALNPVVMVQLIALAINFYFHFSLLKINIEGKIILKLKSLKKNYGIY